MGFWVAAPDALETAAGQLTVQADHNDQSIVDYAQGMQGVWSQWSGEAADAARERNRQWLAQVQMSQDKLRAMAACLQSLSDIYRQCHVTVQRLWRS